MSGQNPMRSGIRAKPGALAPHALDFASRLTEILTPGERDALRRELCSRSPIDRPSSLPKRSSRTARRAM
jgi:hypothetical protein